MSIDMNIPVPNFELPLFTNLLILLVFARVLGELFERIKQPAMIGEILAGIILGPTLLNIIHRTSEINTIAELGVFLLVILAGLEINFDDIFKSFKDRTVIISLFAFFIPLISGLVIGYAFHLELMTTIFVGLCIAITALPVSIRILLDLGKLNSEIGKKIIAIAIFDDVLALTFLGVILNIKKTDMSLISIIEVTSSSLLKLVVFLAILVVAYYIIRKISNKENYFESQLNKMNSLLKSKESLYAFFFVFILLFASITETLGFHFIIGAFFAAMLINKNLVGPIHLDAFHKTSNSLAMGFLAPIFFASIGLEFNFSAIQNYYLLLVVLFVSYFSKIIGGFIGGKINGQSNKVAMTLGFGLNARGIMELLIANIAYNAGLIHLEVFSILVIMGIVTTLSTPFMLKKGFDYIEKK
jgi:Kef-type K+ transport system membrane component KefB